MRKCQIIKFNELLDYKTGLEIQRKAFNKVTNGEVDGIIFLLQHKPIFTIGRNGGKDNLLISKEKLEEYGIDLQDTNRGGNITYHGPGQLVGYPIFNLTKFEKDIILYVRKLEEVIIRTLSNYGVDATRKSEYPGVWVNDKKIAAIGVHKKKWITSHGFAFNIEVNKQHFGLINPCGITDFGIASLNDYIENIDFNEVVQIVESAFNEVFEIESERIDPNQFMEMEDSLC